MDSKVLNSLRLLYNEPLIQAFIQGDFMQDIQFQLNGQTETVNIDPQTPLLWVLRDHLKLKGTKFGCGKGLCGTCTIHLDGQAARACSTPIGSVQNKVVQTIEGVLNDPKYQDLEKAWIEGNVPQCGYCQVGQIMSALSLVKSETKVSEGSIKSHMSGNLCRCGTYQRIQDAILKAAGGQS